MSGEQTRAYQPHLCVCVCLLPDMTGAKTAQLLWAWPEHLDNEKAQTEILKIQFKQKSKTFFYHEGD